MTGYEIVVENYEDVSIGDTTTFIFHAIDNGRIIEYTDFLDTIQGSLGQLFTRLADCNFRGIEVGQMIRSWVMKGVHIL